MKAKFIKHKNPRRSLGLDPLFKREFDSKEDFVDWLYRYLVPNFYGMPNGLKLWKHIMNMLKEEGSGNIPSKLFGYIHEEIIPNITVDGISETDTLLFTLSGYTLLLRQKYPFSTDDSFKNPELYIVKDKIQESNFKRYDNPRKTLGLDPLSKREFKNIKEFIDWLFYYVVPDYYNMPNGPELYQKIKEIVKKDNTRIPRGLARYIYDKIIAPGIKMERDRDKVSNFPILLRERFPFSDFNINLGSDILESNFIKHKNPRDTLGLDPFSKTEFEDLEDLAEWLYKYIVPHFYGMANGPKLWELMKRKTIEEHTKIPIALYHYIKREILPEVRSKEGHEINPLWVPYFLQKKYPFYYEK